MSMEEARRNARMLIALRDAVRAARCWRDVETDLDRRGVALDELRRRLPPRIGLDPHNHSVYSDGYFTPRELVWWCRAMGIRALGITDHDNIHPSLGEAIAEGERLGVRIVPGIEVTIHRLAGQSWKGLELGVHFFPSDRFADFIASSAGRAFCARFEQAARATSEQGWGALERVNRELMESNGLHPITREELWAESGETDPVCPSALTVLSLKRFFRAGRSDLLERFPNTRVIYTHMQRGGLVPPARGAAQTLDDVIAIREAVAAHGIRSTITLNHPEEWLSKCGLVARDGSPDLPGLRRLMLLLMLHDPERAPVSFMELYTSRSSESSRTLFCGLYEEISALCADRLPQLPPLHPIASTDSHRMSGFFDESGEMQGWVPGEDFLFGLGCIDADHPSGSLWVPDNYPDAESMLEIMDRCAT